MGPAPRYFWWAATAVLVLIALILFFTHVDFDDNRVGQAPYGIERVAV